MKQVLTLPAPSNRARGFLLNGLKLVVMLGALGLFLYGIVSTYAFVMYLQEDTVDDFIDGTFYMTGLNSMENTVGLLPIGLTGDWVNDTLLPSPRADLAAVVLPAGTDYPGRIYVIGGYSNTLPYEDSFRDEIYSATIKSNGSLSDWTLLSQGLPRGLRGHRAVIKETTTQTSTIYVLGGQGIIDSVERSVDSVYRIIINNATGAVLSVVTNASSLPYAVHYHSVVLDGDRIYMIGGLRLAPPPERDGTYDQVYYATIAADGSLGDFLQTTGNLPHPLRNSAAALYPGPSKSTIYVMGGTEAAAGSTEITPTVQVVYGDIVAGGDVSSWTPSVTASLPIPVLDHGGVIVNSGELFVLGGRAGELGNPVVSATVKSALADEEDSSRIYNWCGTEPCPRWQGETGENLLEPRSNAGAVYYRNYIYVIGGLAPGPSGGTELMQRTVFRGGVASNPKYRYAPSGWYMSNAIDLYRPYEQARTQVKALSWRVLISDTSRMSLTLQYRHWKSQESPPGWTDASATEAYTSAPAYVYTMTINSPITETRYFQYKASMRSITNTMTPRLDWVRLYFDVPDPEVKVLKTGPVGAYPGETVKYTIYYSATGGVPVKNIVLTDTVPANTTYSSSPGWTLAGGNVYTYFVGTKGVTGTEEYYSHDHPSDWISYSVAVTLTPPVDEKVLTNVVRIGFPPMVDSWGNRVGNSETPGNLFTYTMPIYKISWTIDKGAVPTSTVRPLDIITYTLRYTYTGSSTETGSVRITDVVPIAYFRVVTPYGGGVRVGSVITWVSAVPGLNQSRTVSFTAQVSRPLDNGIQFFNVAQVASDHAPPRSSNTFTHTVVSTPTLTLRKDSKPPAGTQLVAGSTLLYTVTVTNTGSMNATGTIISDVIDSNLTNVWPSPGGILAGGVITWTRSPLQVDVPWVVTFTAQVSNVSGVVITNTGVVLCNQTSLVASNVVTHPVPLRPVLIVQKDDGYAKVARSQILTYTILYGNTGGQAATSVRITDTFPTNVVQPLTNPGWTACGASCQSYARPSALSPGISDTVSFVVQVISPTAPLGPFTNTVTVGGGGLAVSGMGTHMDTVVVPFQLTALSKSDDRDIVGRGEVLTYTITYKNSGELTTTTGVILTDTLPTGMSYVRGSPTWASGGGQVYWADVGNLNPGQVASATLVLRVNGDAVEGPLTNTATLFVEDEIDTYDNTVQDVDTLRTPKLSVSKSDERVAVNPGEFLTYTISYANGGYIAYNIVLTEVLPDQVRYVGYGWQQVSGQTYTRPLPYIAGNSAGSLRLFAQVRPGESGILTNTVTMNADYAEFPLGNQAVDTTTIRYVHDLTVYKTDGVGGVHPDQHITYTVYYTNMSNMAATAWITDTLSDGIAYQSDGSTCNWQPVGGGQQYTVDLGSLPAGLEGNCTMVATVAVSSGFITNMVQIAGTQPDVNPSDNIFTDTDFVTTVPLADFYQVTITPITPTVNVGTNFTVTVYNRGPGEAAHITDLDLAEDETLVGTFRLPPPPPGGIGAAESWIDTKIFVGLYVDPFREPQRPDDYWWTYVGYLDIPIPPATSRIITNTWLVSENPDGTGNYGQLSHNFTVPGWHHLAAQADMWFPGLVGWGPTYGHIPEADESNNIGSLDIWVEAGPPPEPSPGGGGISLPIIRKGS